eukprot:4198273-Prymnesium_polylepis.1
MRVIYTSVYKGAFDAVQFNHHRNAPALSGPDGLPFQWAAALRKGAEPPKSAKGMPTLAKTEPICAPLIVVLTHHPSLGGLKGECASAAARAPQVVLRALEHTGGAGARGCARGHCVQPAASRELRAPRGVGCPPRRLHSAHADAGSA